MSRGLDLSGLPHRPPRRKLLLVGGLSAAVAGFLYFVLPQLAGLDDTWRRLDRGDPAWLAAAFCFELLSFGGYVALFRTVLGDDAIDLGWRRSYQITMAGLAATRLFATAGAGGIVLTAWALRAMGMPGRIVAARLTTLLAAIYAVFMASLVVAGVGLRTGLFPGEAPVGLTVIPAIFGAVAMLGACGLALIPGDRPLRLPLQRVRSERMRRWAGALSTGLGTVAQGTRGALALVARREPGLLGAVAWWGFDIAVLWACFEAFGDGPPAAVLVMGYFTGMLANTLPLPGGVGAVEGGMIGAFIAFGVSGGLAIVAVLSYRVFAFWLPTVPGAIAFVQLRRALSAR